MSQIPDKIWLHKDTKYGTADEVLGYQYAYPQEIPYEGIENFVEYVPADAFIEKACEWLRDNTMAELNLDFGNSQLVREFVDHFKEAMEE